MTDITVPTKRELLDAELLAIVIARTASAKAVSDPSKAIAHLKVAEAALHIRIDLIGTTP